MPKYRQTLDSGQTRIFMDREWEQGVKRDFDNASGPWHIELPRNLQRTKLSVLKKPKSNILTLESEHLRQVFNEVVPKIVDLLRDQIEGIKGATGSAPKVIILVGGFGGNKYFLKIIRERFGSDILIQQPTKAWSAVCRGAVESGATGGDEIFCNHISKYSYGVAHQDDWDPQRHLPADKIFDERLQAQQAKNQMRCYLNKHDDVSQVQKVEHEFRSILRDARQLRSQNYVVYYSDRDNPGTRLAIDHVRRLYIRHMDMSDFDFESFPKFVNKIGKEYRNVDSCLTMDVIVSSVEWSVVCEGKQVKVRVEYDEIISAARIPT